MSTAIDVAKDILIRKFCLKLRSTIKCRFRNRIISLSDLKVVLIVYILLINREETVKGTTEYNMTHSRNAISK